jgi:DNA-binding beta-propeller fold protein YncE
MLGHGRAFACAFLATMLVVAVAAVPEASAAVGDLTPLGCVDDNDTATDSSQGEDACASSTDALAEAASVAISPDGTSLYVASAADDAVVHFSRDPATGALTPQGCIDDNDTATDSAQGEDNCGQMTNGLAGAASVAVSPDGKSVYVAALDDDAIVRFDRDLGTGALTAQDCIDDNDNATDSDQGEDTCGGSFDALQGAISVAVSSDGASVYVASLHDSGIVRFNRNTGTGALTPIQCVNDPSGGDPDCGDIPGLSGAASVTVSPDGKSIYVAAFGDDSVVRIDRDASIGGAFGAESCIKDNDAAVNECGTGNTADGLESAASVAVSPDNASVYVASFEDDAIVRFDRNTGTGALTPQGCIDDNDFAADPAQGEDGCAASTDGLWAASSVNVSPDGTAVYATSVHDAAVVRFDRSLNPGALTPRECVDDNEPGSGTDTCARSADGLNDAQAVVVAPDGTSVYSAAFDDDAVGHFGFEGESPPPPPPPAVTGDNFPPDTKILKGPRKRTKKRKAKFQFGGSEPGLTFECSLDEKAFKPCRSPEKFRRLKRTKHEFAVRAVDAAGNRDPTPADRRWTIKKKKRKK